MGLRDLTVLPPGDGARPRPFRQFIVKVHGRCNLACDYCYVYRHADQSWSRRPPVMPAGIVERLADRIGEHTRRHGLRQARVVLHGGEPLLAGPDTLARVVKTIRAATGADLDFAVQTNGVRLDAAFLRTFVEHRVRVGVSADGGLAHHNRARRFRTGADSFGRVAAALDLLRSPPYRAVYGGIISTVDLAADPLEVYRSLLAFAPPAIVLRPPHGNWLTPPPGLTPDAGSPYGDWLVTVFDAWYGAPRRETAIRLFDSIIQMVLGGWSETDQVGLSRTGAVVVDTDGSIQGNDTLKTTYDGAADTGLNVLTHTFDDALDDGPIRAEQVARHRPPAPCTGCRVASICGGGLYAHRYHPVAGFDQRSVYCADLMRLIGHIRARVLGDVARRRAAVT